MGGVIDSGVFIAAERKNLPARETIEALDRLVPNQPIVIPSIIVAELVHGIYRAQTTQQAEVRRAYVMDILYRIPVVDFTQKIAWTAGQMRGEQAKVGNSLPWPIP